MSQRDLVTERMRHAERLLAHIDRAIEAERGAIDLTKEEMFDVFGDFDPAEYEDEARER